MTCIVAITGGSGAGKTTLAQALGRRLGAPVIAEDDYYHCASRIPGFNAASYNFDAPSAKDHALLLSHLEQARAGAAFEKPLYDLVTHRRRTECERIETAGALVVEGIHLLTPPALRAVFDYKVFVDAPEALRLARRMRRDVETRGRTQRDVEAQFFASVQPMHIAHVEPQRVFADIVLVAKECSPDSVEIAAAQIAAALSMRT